MSERSKLSHGHAQAASEPAHGPKKTTVKSQYDANPSIVLSLTLSLSWQLMFAVLVPILGGHLLDQKLGTEPWITVAGFATAMILMIVVVKRMLKQLNEYMNLPPIDEDEKSKTK